MYKIKVNDNYQFDIHPEEFSWDLIEVEKGRFNILYQNQSISAVVLLADYENKSFSIRVNNNVYNIAAKDRFDLLAEQLGFSSKQTKKSNLIKAPMPGMVLSILVTEGQAIQKGESVIILEAMKMENVLKAAEDGVIKSIKVQQGNPVEKNQALIELE